MLKAGQEAPSFEALAHTGETVKKSDYQGKNILLWFYPKADTPG
jgi:peroxiredoxin Q/BCP